MTLGPKHRAETAPTLENSVKELELAADMLKQGHIDPETNALKLEVDNGTLSVPLRGVIVPKSTDDIECMRILHPAVEVVLPGEDDMRYPKVEQPTIVLSWGSSMEDAQFAFPEISEAVFTPTTNEAQ